MSLSELTSFAVSGGAATALSALITDRVPSAPAASSAQAARASGRAALLITRPATAAANGLVFFFAYYVAATAGLRLGGRHGPDGSATSTRSAATQAFLVGAAAAVCTRLLGPAGSPHGEADASSIGLNEDGTEGKTAEAQHRRPHRWSLAALEDDLVLALDPGLTFCLHEILARLVAQRQWRRQTAAGEAGRPQRSGGGFHAAATTFLLAAASKAVATGVTYPLYTAATAAAGRRQWGRSNTSGGGAAEESKDDNPPNRPGPDLERVRSSILSVLWRITRTGGVRALYADWLRTVATAALGHGLTMAFQRALYGFVLRLMYAAAGALKVRLSGSSRERVPSAQRRVSEEDTAPRAPPAEPAELVGERQHQVTKAVESWLESSTGSADVMKPTENAANARMLQEPPSLPPPQTVVSRPPPPEQQQPPRAESRPLKQDPLPSPDAAMVRYETTRTEKTVSRHNDAPSELPQRPPQERPLPWPQDRESAESAYYAATANGEDDDDGEGSIIFNMISRSPRLVRRE